MTAWQEYLDAHQEQFLDELLAFLRIPSISALSEHREDVQRAAAWVMQRLRAAGMEQVRLLESPGAPAVYAEWLHQPDRPTVLIYGHFDVQPASPLELWESPPFEPAIRNERVYARGASDDKGNMLVPILALEALLRTTGSLPINVKCFFEGEEEIGSPALAACLEQHGDLLACDLVVSADGTQWSEDQPNLLVGLRGLCALQIDVHGPQADLHSGLYGGLVLNPIQALVHILSSLRAPDGSIVVEGFYDQVAAIADADRELMAQVPFDAEAARARLDVPELAGEPGYTPLERLWVRPTLELNGIWGGFAGEGVKTIIPSSAHAKLSCRLAPDQEPARVVECLTAHVRRHAPPGVRVSVQPQPATGYPYSMPTDHWGNQVAARVLHELYGRPPLYIRFGATLPACNAFLQRLGAYTVVFAFGVEDEQFHAPNEFFRLSSFRRGQTAYCRLLEQLAAGA